MIHEKDITTKSSEEKKILLKKALENTCEVKKELKENSGTPEGEQSRIFGSLKEAGKIFKTRKLQKIPVTPEEFDAIKYMMIRDKVGMGVLEPLLLDSNIEDIIV